MVTVTNDCIGNVHVGISPPSVEEIFLLKEATLTCKATGLVSADDLEIKWASETKEFATGTPEIISVNGYFTAVSKLKVTLEEWARGDKFFCTVKQKDSLPSPRVAAYHRELDGPSHRPAVFLLSPSPQESTNGNGEVSLTCFVKDFYPEEVYITWLHSDNSVPQTFYTTTNLIPKKNGKPLFSVYSKLTVPTAEWTDGGIYTCVVYHETIQPPTRMITRNADSTGKQTLVNVGLTLPDKANPCSN
ncbi:Ig mu chain C region [Acipenser ruthenus]|uniref:Ig mu chain C region n=1 Tax=Acipenser ruthenus TaxID=7906 RepID=A0A444V141_ACIRT|nr:Ig mu chain C region [Acipenser ruthenus]